MSTTYLPTRPHGCKSLEDLPCPKSLRQDRIRSAYDFGIHSTKYTKQKEDLFQAEIERQKQKFLLAANISENEYNQLSKKADLKLNKITAIKNKNKKDKQDLDTSFSDIKLALTDYWLIQNEDCRMATMQSNELTSIEYQKTKKHLMIAHQIKINEINREIKKWKKKLIDLKNSRHQDSKAILNLKRRVANQRIEDERKSQAMMSRVRRKQSIDLNRFNMESRNSSLMSLSSFKGNSRLKKHNSDRSLASGFSFGSAFETSRLDDYISRRPQSALVLC